MNKIDPYNVQGALDYDKLIKEFGVKRLDQGTLSKLRGNVPKYIKRGFAYAHRDFDKFISRLESGEPSAIVSGRGPSSHMHIGHLVPLFFLKYFQEEYGCTIYIPISDDEKYYAKDITIDQVIAYAKENLLDIMAVGFDPKKTKVIMDFISIGKFYKYVAMIAKKITFNTVKGLMGFDESTNVGLLFYPAIQSAHILYPNFFDNISNILVPIGIDQDPYMRVVRDYAESLGFEKPCSIYTKYLPPLTGIEGKMSASDPNTCIYLTDDEETVKKKIKRAVTGGRKTLEDQRKYGGSPERCVVYHYLLAMFAEDDEINEIYQGCVEGQRLCGQCKELLIERILKFLTEHAEKREKYKDIIEDIIEK